jgi:hypothetical protein
VNCGQARKLMHQLLDGTLADRGPFDRHLQQCDGCRIELARLRQIQDAVGETVRCQVDESELARMTAGVMAAVRVPDLASRPPAGGLRWAFAGALAGLVFVLGVGTGRAVWPQRLVETEVVTRTEVEEKIVKVEVPVIKEVLVEKRVPIVRTRIVYRDRAEPGRGGDVPAGPVKADEVVFRVDAEPTAAPAVVSREIHPVTVVEPEAPDAAPAEPEHGARDAAPDELAAVPVMVAARPPIPQ